MTTKGIASLPDPDLAHRRREDVCGRAIVAEFDAADLLAAAQNFLGRCNDLLDILVGSWTGVRFMEYLRFGRLIAAPVDGSPIPGGSFGVGS